MRIVLAEVRHEMQEKYLEVLSWFRAVDSVAVARSRDELLGKGDLAQAVIIGKVNDCDTSRAVAAARERFPSVRLIAVVDGNPAVGATEAACTAGADHAIDLRFSIWKTGIILREMLFASPDQDRSERIESVPGLSVEAG